VDAKPERRWMQEAARIALEGVARGAGGPFGALIVRGGVVLGRASNRVLATNDPTAHAEVLAIRRAARRIGSFSLAGCELYATCEPCPMCLAAAYWSRLDRIWYACDQADAARAGFDDAAFHAELARPPAARRLPQSQVFRPDALPALEAWLTKPDRVPY
jgi:tRNA(Arg) A34 adenosine deaminase TadA